MIWNLEKHSKQYYHSFLSIEGKNILSLLHINLKEECTLVFILKLCHILKEQNDLVYITLKCSSSDK
jgi:hypothetical protein